MDDRKINVDSYTIEISNLGKVFFPDENITKGDLIDYYRRIAPIMLPYLEERPLMMHRFPDGISKQGFYQKEISDYFPDYIQRTSVEKKEQGGSQTLVVCNNAATLVYLANQACITPHVWLSRRDNPEYPDKLIFDLDPPSVDFEPVRTGARLLKEMLEEIGLTSFVMTTGSKGLHVMVPLDRKGDFNTVRAFASGLADFLAQKEPELFTTETRKDKRQDRIFLDYLRNAYAQTAVPPYAVRAKFGAPVAAPLDWHELESRKLHSSTYNLKNIFRRLGQKDDPWQKAMHKPESLDKPRKRLEDMIANS